MTEIKLKEFYINGIYPNKSYSAFQVIKID